jgi:hypothetical protein
MDAIDTPIPIVTGAHLAAEVGDRPWAYWLRERVEASALAARVGTAVVCTDLWYLNHDELRGRPTLCVGGPSVNALSAYLASRLPSVLSVEGVWVVLMDVEADTPQACCWGRDAAATGAAVQAFGERYLEAFLEAAS